MKSKSIVIPMAPKAVEKIAQVAADLRHREGPEARLNMNDVQNLCGWDADAKFSQARARMKTAEGVNIGHHVVFSAEGVPQHLFVEMKRR